MSGSVAFGSAQLMVQRMPEAAARALLEAAVQAGAARLDTAPLYGHGRSEGLVGRVAARHRGLAVTTKVGLEPAEPPPAWRWAAGAALRRVPLLAGAAKALRSRARDAYEPADDPQAHSFSGRFGIDTVRRSIERSLERLGRIDRLLLHEVHLPDLTDELLTLLQAYKRRGDVAELGLATGNSITTQALRMGSGTFSVVHVSADPWQPQILAALRASPVVPVHAVAHGALGADGRVLAALQQRLNVDTDLRKRWMTAVRGTVFCAEDGMVDALFSHAAASGFKELVVATRRLQRVSGLVRAAAALEPLPAAASRLLNDMLKPPPP